MHTRKGGGEMRFVLAWVVLLFAASTNDVCACVAYFGISTFLCLWKIADIIAALGDKLSKIDVADVVVKVLSIKLDGDNGRDGTK